jgi:hypothetical protein
MNFALLMLVGTILTRVVHHIKSKTKKVLASEEILDFAATYVVYTILFIVVYNFLLWSL